MPNWGQKKKVKKGFQLTKNYFVKLAEIHSKVQPQERMQLIQEWILAQGKMTGDNEAKADFELKKKTNKKYILNI